MFTDVFEARFEHVAECIDRALEHLLSEGVDDSLASICMLALTEAINNVVEHSYKEDECGDIQLNIDVKQSSLVFKILDQGIEPPENIFAAAKGMPDPEDLPEGGWGLAVIDTVMDDISYSNANGFNQLELVKRIEPWAI